VAAVLGGATLLAGSWVVVVAQDRVPAAEERVFTAVNGLPGGLWPLVWGPMQTGSFGGSLAIVGATAAVSRDTRLTVAALAGSQAAFWTAKVVKASVSRGRPGALLTEIHLHERATGFGYVSFHAAVAASLVAVLAPSVPARWRPALVAVAAVVGFGRVFGGAHLPLDVIGGTGVGLLAGTFARWALGLGGEGLPVRRVGRARRRPADAGRTS
jgi:glycosyltransferase 2 family protein